LKVLKLIAKKKLKDYKMLFDDQYHVNNQYWSWLKRVKKFLTEEDDMEEKPQLN